MRRIILTFLLALAAMAGGASSPALAHQADFLMYRPYAIEKTCNDRFKHCKPRMIYAPGQHAGLAGTGSYWYQKSPGARKHGDFTLRSHKHKAHAHKAHVKRKRHAVVKHRSSYKHYCRKKGWGFNTQTLTFAGGIPKRARCIPAYDTR
jgi:hypothetical protein